MCSKIKVWDLQAALDPRAPAGTLCLRTLVVSFISASLLAEGLSTYCLKLFLKDPSSPSPPIVLTDYKLLDNGVCFLCFLKSDEIPSLECTYFEHLLCADEICFTLI